MSARSKLIENAIALFSERGYTGTRLSDIAERTGTNIALISYHFGNKKGLLIAALRTLHKERIIDSSRVLRTCENKTDFFVRLEMFLGELFTVYIEQASLVKLLFELMEQGEREAVIEFNATHVGITRDLEEFLKEGQQRGFLNKSTSICVLLIQLVGPLSLLVRSKNTAKKYLGISVLNEKFRRELVQSIISCVASEGEHSSNVSQEEC